ncbi:zinc-dependent alcohol dehydrogenase family protein [Bacillus capparidis]|uniref:2-desacetyl-2-hydroxyethyl bacteriochlorophyllide A dehydrogenase n=1 Tax=Bacillus capparidis TaxID=1840411 RepID=A0ABS4CW88_9BACI|nr:zinc-dependent alcohol dehydrogenase family protein [Bacillus capparidis]MBP1081386.1 2-desacetyl-2-hydroxyethyl bacteriochlorophyllide A dehydrogenase [Bacillus capparidis]MED1096059.1 zinc-dependent alcohol dehydrogenase family protein [Bacillus capparidis]
MKALVLTENKRMELQEVSEEPLADNEMKVKVKYVGICGTDKHLFHGQPGSAQANPPIVLGHEISGVIAEAGKGVKSQLKVGDRVTIDPNISCGYCDYCHENKPQLCVNMQAIGVTRDGGMAEYVNVPETNIYKIPDSLSFKEAAMAEPVSCVVYGIRQLTIKPQYTALVVGDGIIGQMFTQYLANRGLKKVDVSGRNPKKVETLKKIGATKVFNPEKEEHDEKYDIVIECVGVTATQERAINFARRGGQVLMFGVSNPDDLIQVNAYDIFFKELTIKGAFVNPYSMRDAIHILADKTVDAEQLITHEINLEDVPDVLAGNINYKITKAIIKLDDE